MSASYTLQEVDVRIVLRRPSQSHRAELARLTGIPIKERPSEATTPDLIILTFRTGELGAEGRRQRVTQYLRHHGIFHRVHVTKDYDPGLGREPLSAELLLDLIARQLETNVVLHPVNEGKRIGLFNDLNLKPSMILTRQDRDLSHQVQQAHKALTTYLEGKHRMELAEQRDATGEAYFTGLWVYRLRSSENAS